MQLPSQVRVLGVVYTITYVDSPSDVDIHRRESLWGQVDFWTTSIRIYKRSGNDSSTFQTLWHEIIHIIATQLHIKYGEEKDLNADEKTIDLLATGISSVLADNGWLLPCSGGRMLRNMSISTFLIILLVLLLLGVFPSWPHSRSWGNGPAGLVVVVLVVVIFLILTGRL